MKKQAGFTLVELMIVVVVVAILASIALPAYRDSVRKSDRRAAQAVMMDIAHRQQQYFIANRVFATEDELDYTLPPEVAGKYGFTMTVDNDTRPPSFTINFAAQGAQEADGDLALTSTGVKTPAGKW